ncbi:MAG: uracil-DNA glycosylase [Candidatus Sumerlaeota bacterium]|nr:uracil-DNA glycosylase [Candidatus Sumerlaeota bacterium]
MTVLECGCQQKHKTPPLPLGRMMLDHLIDSLAHSPAREGVFNPWRDMDPDNDIGPEAPEIRRRQLLQYLSERAGKTVYLLAGEAIGYQGGHFSGIAMTSERILLGHLRDKGIYPEHVFSGLTPQRTSRPEIKPLGFSEPTATIVWGQIAALGADPKAFLIWNAFPWHPFKPAQGRLTNRTPGDDEMRAGAEILHEVIALMRPRHILAIGEKAKFSLDCLGVSAVKIRHPANGGATQFREQFMEYVTKNN